MRAHTLTSLLLKLGRSETPPLFGAIDGLSFHDGQTIYHIEAGHYGEGTGKLQIYGPPVVRDLYGWWEDLAISGWRHGSKQAPTSDEPVYRDLTVRLPHSAAACGSAQDRFTVPLILSEETTLYGLLDRVHVGLMDTGLFERVAQSSLYVAAKTDSGHLYRKYEVWQFTVCREEGHIRSDFSDYAARCASCVRAHADRLTAWREEREARDTIYRLSLTDSRGRRR